jgi:hypothetical protein
MARPVPIYSFEIRFCETLDIRPETGRRYRKLGVLVPDTWVDNRPLYLSDPLNVEKHRQSLAHYRARIARASNNVKRTRLCLTDAVVWEIGELPDPELDR